MPYTPVNVYRIPTHTVAYSQPAFHDVIKTGPVITGTLHNTQDTYGAYRYSYDSSDGQSKTESREVDGSVRGHFSYFSPEGKQISLSYIADKDGFRPIGDHLPVPPELPADLAKAYKESNDRLAKAYQESHLRGHGEFSDDGSYKQKYIKVPYARPPTSSYSYAMVVPTTMVSHASVMKNEVPMKNSYATPAQEAPAQEYSPSYSTEPTTTEVSTPPKQNDYAYQTPVPAAPQPTHHSSTSYCTNVPETPMNNGYEVTGYEQSPPELPKPVQHSSTSYSAVIGGVPTFASSISIAAAPMKSAYDYNEYQAPVPTPPSTPYAVETTENPSYGY